MVVSSDDCFEIPLCIAKVPIVSLLDVCEIWEHIFCSKNRILICSQYMSHVGIWCYVVVC